ncbi:MAG: phytanoyl-CoA dioxygenase family protein [Bacillota bacterium]
MEDKQSFQEQGYIVQSQMFTKEEVDSINNEYQRIWLQLIEERKIVQNSEQPLISLFPRLRDYHNHSEIIKKHILKPEFYERIEFLAGQKLVIVATSYYFKAPGTRGLPIHQDNYAIGVSPGTTYAAWISLDNCDNENGGMLVVPRTGDMELLEPKRYSSDPVRHFSDYGQEVDVPQAHEVVEVGTSIGDVLIFTGNTLHGSSDNVSSYRFRYSLIIHFAPSDLEKVTFNYNSLMDNKGNRIRKRLNSTPKITEPFGSVFSFKDADYFTNNGWK